MTRAGYVFGKEQARIFLLATQGETFSLDETVSEWKEEDCFFFLFLFLMEILILVERKVDTAGLEAQGLVRYDAACLGRAERQNREHMRSLSWEFR